MKRHPTEQRYKAIWLAAPLLWAAVILWLSMTPSPPSPPTFLSWDKLQHAAAYALLTLLTGQVIAPFFRTLRSRWLWAALVAVVYGALMELMQGLLSEVRHADVGDLLANAAGAATALIMVRLWRVLQRVRGL